MGLTGTALFIKKRADYAISQRDNKSGKSAGAF